MLLFAICAIVISIAMRRLDTDAGALLAAGVNLPLGILLVSVQLSVLGPLRTPSLSGILAFLLAGVFSTYLGRWLYFRSIETLGPTRASSFQTSSPLVTALLGWLLLGDRLSNMALAGMALGVVGLAAMSQGARGQQAVASKHTARKSAGIGRGVLAIGLGSSAAYAVSHVLRAAAIREWSEPIAGATLGAAAGMLALLLVNRRNLAPMVARIAASRTSAWLYCAVGVMQLTAQVLMIASMAHIPASFAALITMCTPLVVLPLSFVLFKNSEGIRYHTVLGMLATIAGVVLLMLYGR